MNQNHEYENLKNCILTYFHDCNEYLKEYDENNLNIFLLIEPVYKIKIDGRSKTLEKRYTKRIKWRSFFQTHENTFVNFESIEPCLNELTKLFDLMPVHNSDDESLTGEELVKANHNMWKTNLANLYFQYREYNDKSEIDPAPFIDEIINGMLSNKIYTSFSSQLIGFDSDIEEIRIGGCLIKKPSAQCLEKFLADIHHRLFAFSTEPDLVFGPRLSYFNDSSSYWLYYTEEREKSKRQKKYFPLPPDYPIRLDYGNTIHQEILKILLVFRLNSRNIGINTAFIQSYYSKGLKDFHSIIEVPFLYSNFGKASPLSWVNSEKIENQEISEYNRIYELLTAYEENNIKQIDKALNHYLASFEHNIPAYKYADLFICLESLFKNTSDRSTQVKERLSKIQRFDTNCFEFIEQCYQIRNDLLHGDIGLEEDKLKRTIPKLTIYVGSSLLKIIEFRVDGVLQGDENTYYQNLDEILNNNNHFE